MDGLFGVGNPAAMAQDATGNDNTAATPVSASHDGTAPRVVDSELSGPVDGVYTLTLTFSEPIDGLTPDDFGVANATVAVGGSGARHVIVITPAGGGRINVTLPDDIAKDDAGNGNAGAALVDLAHVPVSPAVALITAQTAITGTSSFAVDVSFSEPVTGLTLDEVENSGGTVTALSGADADYVMIVRPSCVGDVALRIPAGVAQSALGAGNLASATLVIGNTSVDET